MSQPAQRSSAASRAVAAKLAVLIIAAAGAAAAMLSMRQQRLQAVYELSQAHVRASTHERAVRRLEAEIARRVAPHRLERMADGARFQPAVEGLEAARRREQAELQAATFAALAAGSAEDEVATP